jgi:hypothetical protein
MIVVNAEQQALVQTLQKHYDTPTADYVKFMYYVLDTQREQIATLQDQVNTLQVQVNTLKEHALNKTATHKTKQNTKTASNK